MHVFVLPHGGNRMGHHIQAVKFADVVIIRDVNQWQLREQKLV